MTDFINKDFPVVNADEDGNYPWQRVKCGADSSVGKMTLYQPLNFNQTVFVYNIPGVFCGSIYKFNNILTSVAAAIGTFVEAIPNPAGYTIEHQDAGQITADANTGRITNATGGNVNVLVYWEVDAINVGDDTVVPVVPPVDDDVVSIGLGLAVGAAAPADPAGAGQIDTKVCSSTLNGKTATTKYKGSFANAALATTENYSLRVDNTSSANRRILIKNAKVVISRRLSMV